MHCENTLHDGTHGDGWKWSREKEKKNKAEKIKEEQENWIHVYEMKIIGQWMK